MSAAVNDRPHTAYSAVTHLPLIGELHPLRRDFERWLMTGNAITITVALIVFASIYFWPRPAEVKRPIIEFRHPPGVWPSPPPIDPNGGGGPGMPTVAPDIERAIPDPVDDEELKSDDGLVDSHSGTGEPGEDPGSDWVDGGDNDFIDPPAQPAQSPPLDWWDEAPALVSINAPSYPQMVRDAGIDGTVMVRVLVGVNGKVKNAYVVEGSDALRESALASARTAVFKPALQGTHPVEVWVVIPITFELRDRH